MSNKSSKTPNNKFNLTITFINHNSKITKKKDFFFRKSKTLPIKMHILFIQQEKDDVSSAREKGYLQ